MTHDASTVEQAPAASSPAPRTRPPMVGRLVGVDLARGLAIFGMYAAHVGPDPSVGGITGRLMEVCHGRSSALFALLAGFSLVLLTGRRVPKTGLEGRQSVVRVLIRSLILLVLGTALTMAGTQVDVILAFYSLYFVLALPLRRLRAGALAALAAVSALVLPQVLYVVRLSIDTGTWAETVIDHDPLARISGTDGVVDLLFTGAYPVLTWMPYVIAGMAVARLDLASATVRLRLAVAGGVLAVLGSGGSWLALHLFPGVSAAIGASGDGTGSAASAWWSDLVGDPTGDTPAWLLVASPHSETTLSILSNTGVAIAVLTACIAATDRLPRFRRLATPVITVGTMSLTAYVFNIAGIWALGIKEVPGSPLPVLLGFVAAITLLAAVWARFFRRGPLEYLVNSATMVAHHVR
ncbi:DUF418 domain-containing protein [Streptantibioticus ferralitis]|uniref:DUF418 domain-containing protein n=1 Tax=Streptantibioticus ferralitis TaxID=236510 RepID=A0ABT5YUM7_9ACTN|nr:DUF418 domain-containing protein [Streptantibioticus ferralitis]MDF2255168.1 DUF418 domain-containing protein [Streptantibioticus ferralitis]